MHSRNLENTRRSCIFSHLNTCHASILYSIMQYKWQPRIFTLAATFSTRRACSAFASPLHESVFLGSSDGSSLEWAKTAAKLLDTVSGGACLLPRDHSTKKITMEIGKKKIAWSWANVPVWHQVMLTRIQKNGSTWSETDYRIMQGKTLDGLNYDIDLVMKQKSAQILSVGYFQKCQNGQKHHKDGQTYSNLLLWQKIGWLPRAKLIPCHLYQGDAGQTDLELKDMCQD